MFTSEFRNERHKMLKETTSVNEPDTIIVTCSLVITQNVLNSYTIQYIYACNTCESPSKSRNDPKKSHDKARLKTKEKSNLKANADKQRLFQAMNTIQKESTYN